MSESVFPYLCGYCGTRRMDDGELVHFENCSRPDKSAAGGPAETPRPDFFKRHAEDLPPRMLVYKASDVDALLALGVPPAQHRQCVKCDDAEDDHGDFGFRDHAFVLAVGVCDRCDVERVGKAELCWKCAREIEVGVPPAAPPTQQAADLVRRWNSFLGNGGFFNPGMIANCNEDALRELVLNTRDFLVGLTASSDATNRGVLRVNRTADWIHPAERQENARAVTDAELDHLEGKERP